MTSEKKKSVRRLEGQIIRIDLKDGTHAYGRVLRRPLFAFYDRLYADSHESTLEEIATLPIAFKIYVMDYAVPKQIWAVIGRIALTPDLQRSPNFFKQDIMNGSLSIYDDNLPPTYERPATYQECLGLEQAAVWDPHHVEERLRDHFAGCSNRWIEYPMAPEDFQARQDEIRRKRDSA